MICEHHLCYWIIHIDCWSF